MGANILGVAFREKNLESNEALSGGKWLGKEGRVWASRGLMIETGEGNPVGSRVRAGFPWASHKATPVFEVSCTCHTHEQRFTE